jgi:16S rRNA (guanine1207-N2)-methyltransferase
VRGIPYESALEARIGDEPVTYRFRAADGVASKRSFRAAELALLEELWETDPGRLLCPQANYGVVGTVLAARADETLLTESSARAAELCRRNVRANDADATVRLRADLSTLDGTFDAVAYAPKEYTPLPVGKRRTADALRALAPGGTLYLAAADAAGLSRYEDCLREIAADVAVAGTHGDVDVVEATRPERVETPSYVTPRRLEPTVDGVDLSLVSVPGLFAAAALDHGTRLLAETVSVEDGERVLDLCCGYGALGTYAARSADAAVTLTDDDRVATRCAECSLRVSDVDGSVVTGDCLEAVADRTFDRILTNPPTHAGSAILAELLGDARDRLARGGTLHAVHHRDLNLREHLGGYGHVERQAEGEEHAVLRVRA